jgi:hypothetical protein
VFVLTESIEQGVVQMWAIDTSKLEVDSESGFQLHWLEGVRLGGVASDVTHTE